MRHLNFKFPRDAKLNSMLPVYNYKYTLRANLNSNVVLSVPHSRSINSNFKADVLGTQAKSEKMLMAFVISISKLTAMDRSGEEVRKPCSCSLLVSQLGSIGIYIKNNRIKNF